MIKRVLTLPPTNYSLRPMMNKYLHPCSTAFYLQSPTTNPNTPKGTPKTKRSPKGGSPKTKGKPKTPKTPNTGGRGKF